MGENPYWFEDVPEEQRYWFVTQWERPPAWEAQGTEPPPGISRTELENIEEEVRAETFWDIPREEVHKIRELTERMEASEFRPGAVSSQDPWWGELEGKWLHEEGREHLEAPQLFTTRGAAEAQLHHLNAELPQAYLDVVKEHGAAAADEAFDNAAPLVLGWVDQGTLLDSLEEADFLCVMVDHRLKLRQDFMEELSGL